MGLYSNQNKEYMISIQICLTFSLSKCLRLFLCVFFKLRQNIVKGSEENGLNLDSIMNVQLSTKETTPH